MTTYTAAREFWSDESLVRGLDPFLHLKKECDAVIQDNSRVKQLIAELDLVYKNADEEGWDGYHAQPADIQSYYKAREFLSLLPPNITSPDISVDSEGDITFEWYITITRHVILSFGSNSFIDYVGIIGKNSQKGCESFAQNIPQTISSLFQRAFSK